MIKRCCDNDETMDNKHSIDFMSRSLSNCKFFNCEIFCCVIYLFYFFIFFNHTYYDFFFSFRLNYCLCFVSIFMFVPLCTGTCTNVNNPLYTDSNNLFLLVILTLKIRYTIILKKEIVSALKTEFLIYVNYFFWSSTSRISTYGA